MHGKTNQNAIPTPKSNFYFIKIVVKKMAVVTGHSVMCNELTAIAEQSVNTMSSSHCNPIVYCFKEPTWENYPHSELQEKYQKSNLACLESLYRHYCPSLRKGLDQCICNSNCKVKALEYIPRMCLFILYLEISYYMIKNINLTKWFSW